MEATEIQTKTVDTVAADLKGVSHALEGITAKLNEARTKVYRPAFDNQANPDAFRAIVSEGLSVLDPVERAADEHLAGLIRSLEENRKWLSSRDWRADVSDAEMSAVNTHVPVITTLVASADAADLAAAARDAAEYPDRARAAAWTLLIPAIKARNFPQDNDRVALELALSKCRQRVTDRTVSELEDALAQIRFHVESARSDLATRRGDGQTGSLLQRYQFGRRGNETTPDPLDVDAVFRRVGN